MADAAVPGTGDVQIERLGEHLAGEIPCSDEEIRVPGSIQPHGFLLAVDPETEKVLFGSENAEDFLGVPLKLLIGSTLDLVLERELLASVRGLRCSIDPEGLVTYLGAFRLRGELLSVVTHCVEGTRILEFERQDRLVGAEMMNSVITNFVGNLSRIESESELCRAITRQVFELTGFDRVMLYSFDAAGHGTVLAEENSGALPSYLDLRFPATDIPAQARALYIANTVRIIPDANYVASPLRGPAQLTPEKLDMSQSILRSVSPVHLQYMRNMGTLSSMSISILVEGRLWGLISGHHTTPRVVPYLIRSACDMLTKMVGTQINAFNTAEKLRTTVRFHEVQRSMITQMAAENDYVAAIGKQMPSLMQITNAAGAVLAMEGEFNRIGETPSDEHLRRIVDWLETRTGLDLFETNYFSSEQAWAAEFSDVASGMIAIRISDVRARFILWFRPEVVRTVKWAGEPVKYLDSTMHLNPRTSFEQWKETLRGQSIPWTAVEVESAREFRNAVTTISLRRMEEEAELSEARFNRLTETVPVKVFAVTDEGRLTYVNARWKESGMGETGLWYSPERLAAEDAHRCADAWKQAVAQETPFEEEVRIVGRTTGDGEAWNLVRLVPFSREGAARAGWIGACIDLTERRQREAAIRVTEKLTITGRMTSYLAHEINNPLEAITNLLYLIRMDLGENDGARQYFSMIDGELERISGTVKQTLRWSSENSEKRSRFPVQNLFEDSTRLLGAKIRNRQVIVEVENPDGLTIVGIESQLRQVVAHLLSNALDAVAIGGRVRLIARKAEGDLQLSVEDNGTGISAADQQSLFKPFFSTKGDLGNGLGLYITKEIAERHHGHFTVQSALGEGTAVTLRLPLTGENA